MAKRYSESKEKKVSGLGLPNEVMMKDYPELAVFDMEGYVDTQPEIDKKRNETISKLRSISVKGTK